MEIISKCDARSLGVKRYFTGIPCKRGHVCERFVSAGHCVECDAEKFSRNPAWRAKSRKKKQEWAEANPEKVKEAQEKTKLRPDYREKQKKFANRCRSTNKEKDKERAKIWRQNNPELAAAVTRAWRQKNKDKLAAKEHRRRSRKAGGGGSYKSSDIREIFFAQRGKCAFCRVKLTSVRYEIDHIIPVLNGGSSNRQNLQLLCKPCNAAKGSKDQIDFMKANGRLL